MKHGRERVRAYAHVKLQGSAEPPWPWYQYMTLGEAADAVRFGMEVTMPMESLPPVAGQTDTHFRLMDSTRSPESVRHHPAGLPGQPPT